MLVVAGCCAGMSMGGGNIAHRVGTQGTHTQLTGDPGIGLLPLVTDVFSLNQDLRANIINDTMWTLDTCIVIQVSRCTRDTCQCVRVLPPVLLLLVAVSPHSAHTRHPAPGRALGTGRASGKAET